MTTDSHDVNPLPQRDPYRSFAEHGMPPENPSPHTNPWAYRNTTGAGHPVWGGAPAPRKSRTWIWVLMVIAALALCGFGIVAVSVGGTAVVDQIDRQASDRQADITITSCSGDRFGLVTIKYTVHNGSATAQSYLPGFNVESKTGTVYGQTADIVNDLAPGKDYQGSAVASVGQQRKDIVCKLTGA